MSSRREYPGATVQELEALAFLQVLEDETFRVDKHKVIAAAERERHLSWIEERRREIAGACRLRGGGASTSLTEQSKELVRLATVRVEGGQGVLIPGGLVVTAAHCIEWDGSGGTALGDYHPTKVTTADGRSFRMEVGAADPRADIGVLEALDDQEFAEDVRIYEEWAQISKGVPLRTSVPAVGESIHVSIRTHVGEWVSGTVTRWGAIMRGSLFLEADAAILGGTSGGPVVDDDGCLVGVISNVSEEPTNGKYHGDLPFVSMALPNWAGAIALHIDAA